jgi:hypothetical protein
MAVPLFFTGFLPHTTGGLEKQFAGSLYQLFPGSASGNAKLRSRTWGVAGNVDGKPSRGAFFAFS